MSGPDIPDDADDMDPDAILAMGFVLGTLSAAERRTAEARHAAEPAFRAACDGWAATLVPLSDEIEPVPPTPALWERIEAATAPAAPAAEVSVRRAGLWESLGFWRGATAVSAAAALAAVVLPRGPVPEPVPEPVQGPEPGTLLSATLVPETGGALLTAALDTDRRAVVVAPVGEQDLKGRVPQLWLIPADGTPRSLGLISLGGTQRVAVPDTVLQLVAEGAVLAVSLEPAGGSPTGLPTGPVVATGKLTAL
jgi:anti-sigma-K factor RskA